MRLFSAVAIAPEAQREIERVERGLAERVDVKRWQPVANMHVTLHFFGEVPEEAVPPLAERLSDASHVLAPFELRLGSLGAFPRRGQPRVLWLGVDDLTQGLHALEQTMRAAIADLGLLAEVRPYSPHITLARDPRTTLRVADLAAEVAVEPIRWRVEQAALYRSILAPQGAQYSVLHRFPFQGEPPRPLRSRD